jgi:hypothetical protein
VDLENDCVTEVDLRASTFSTEKSSRSKASHSELLSQFD